MYYWDNNPFFDLETDKSGESSSDEESTISPKFHFPPSREKDPLELMNDVLYKKDFRYSTFQFTANDKKGPVEERSFRLSEGSELYVKNSIDKLEIPVEVDPDTCLPIQRNIIQDDNVDLDFPGLWDEFFKTRSGTYLLVSNLISGTIVYRHYGKRREKFIGRIYLTNTTVTLSEENLKNRYERDGETTSYKLKYVEGRYEFKAEVGAFTKRAR